MKEQDDSVDIRCRAPGNWSTWLNWKGFEMLQNLNTTGHEQQLELREYVDGIYSN